MAANPLGATSLCIDLETRDRLLAIRDAIGADSLAGVVRGLAATVRPLGTGEGVEHVAELTGALTVLPPRRARLARLGIADPRR